MVIVYSFNKRGQEEEFWNREIRAASGELHEFVCFNHDPYLDWSLYRRAQLLDDLFFDKDPRLLRMYEDLRGVIEKSSADALIVDNCHPYHPEFLNTLPVYKVLRTTDGPMSAYDRDFAYVHAYDHVLYHSPAYSPEMTMKEKLAYCGAVRTDLWPLGAWDATMDASASEIDVMSRERDIDILFIGALHWGKMPLLAKVKKVFGRRCHFVAIGGWKRLAYFNAKFGFPGPYWPPANAWYSSLYPRAKIGFNVHNRGIYTVGSYRLFELPANGVMQISDGGEFLDEFYETGKEIVGYDTVDELIQKIDYYLTHEDERANIAVNGYRRTMSDHRMSKRLRDAGELIAHGIAQEGRK